MKHIYLIILIFLFFRPAQAQINLVPNPSFEDTVGCPSNISGQYGDEIYKLHNWFPAGESPDYFNACAPSIQSISECSVPINGFGYQNPNSGSGYIGLYTAVNSPIFFNYREYVGVQLIQSVINGFKYNFRMKVSCGWGGWQYNGVFSNKIGIKLSNTYFESQFNPLLPTNSCTAYYDTIVSDTINWKEISFDFIADSNYQYLYIGNFFDSQNTDTILYFGRGAYYYIDDVYLAKDTTYTVNVENHPILFVDSSPEIFPNPINSILKIKSFWNSGFVIYNNIGQAIYDNHVFNGINEYDVSFLPSGYYIIKFTDDLSKQYKIIKL